MRVCRCAKVRRSSSGWLFVTPRVGRAGRKKQKVRVVNENGKRTAHGHQANATLRGSRQRCCHGASNLTSTNLNRFIRPRLTYLPCCCLILLAHRPHKPAYHGQRNVSHAPRRGSGSYILVEPERPPRDKVLRQHHDRQQRRRQNAR